jgi:hypothetical protein
MHAVLQSLRASQKPHCSDVMTHNVTTPHPSLLQILSVWMHATDGDADVNKVIICLAVDTTRWRTTGGAHPATARWRSCPCRSFGGSQEALTADPTWSCNLHWTEGSAAQLQKCSLWPCNQRCRCTTERLGHIRRRCLKCQMHSNHRSLCIVALNRGMAAFEERLRRHRSWQSM